jgi:glycosyltransferase involved in cell wall biosynthesis
MIARAHCVVLPSYREGTPRALLEAAAMARPMIASRVPGCVNVVSDQVNGLLCEVRNPESLAQCMNAFLGMPQAALIAMGQAGRAMVERKFDETLVIDRYEHAIKAALAKKSDR